MKSRFFALLALLLLTTGAWARNAPDFTLPDSDGRQVTLSNYRGKYVVLEFLAITCPHCQAASKALEKIQLEYPEQLLVLGVSTGGQGVVALTDYKKAFGVTYPVLQADTKILMDYMGINPMQPNYHIPWFFLIDPSGRIVREVSADRASDVAFYTNPDPKAKPEESGDAWLMKNVEAMVQQAIPKKAVKAGIKRPAAAAKKPASKKTAAAKP